MITKTLIATILFASAFFTAGAQTQKRDFVVANIENAVLPNPKVAVNFKRAYPDIENEKWTIERGYYFATFKKGDVKNQVAYRQNGQLDYAMKVYGEKRLPSRVRSTVKSVYYDYSIINAQEIELDKSTTYIVKLTREKTSKTVRVKDGTIEEIESYSSVISPCR